MIASEFDVFEHMFDVIDNEAKKYSPNVRGCKKAFTSSLDRSKESMKPNTSNFARNFSAVAKNLPAFAENF